ncbi:MAG: hypothetical protein AAFY34_10965 [Pseudomonadota bacterium]
MTEFEGNSNHSTSCVVLGNEISSAFMGQYKRVRRQNLGGFSQAIYQSTFLPFAASGGLIAGLSAIENGWPDEGSCLQKRRYVQIRAQQALSEFRNAYQTRGCSDSELANGSMTANECGITEQSPLLSPTYDNMFGGDVPVAE